MAHWHKIFPGQIMEVVYEDLVEDTEGWARKMIAHLGLEWELRVLDFQNLERPVKTASVWQVRQPVYKTSKERWRRYEKWLGPLERALSQIPCNPEPLPVNYGQAGIFDEAMNALKASNLIAAETGFRRLIDINPKHAAAHHFLGATLLQMGRTNEACQMMRRSVKLLRAHPSWFNNLAIAEEVAGNVEQANSARAMAKRLLNQRQTAPL